MSKRAPFSKRLVQGGEVQVPMPPQMVGALAMVQGLSHQMTRYLESLEGSPVLSSGTYAITATGAYARTYQVQYAAVHIFNGSASHPMTLSTGGPGDHTTPPTTGPGLFTIQAGHSATIPMIGNSVNVIGTPGDLLRLIVLTRFVPPFAS